MSEEAWLVGEKWLEVNPLELLAEARSLSGVLTKVYTFSFPMSLLRSHVGCHREFECSPSK